MAASDCRVLKDTVLAVRDGLHNSANIVLEPATIHPGELAERRLVVHPAFGRHQLALQHDFSVDWHHEVDGLALNELRRPAVETAEHLEVVDIRRKAFER